MKNSHNDNKQIDLDLHTYLQPRKNSTSNMDIAYLLEVEGVCPKCGKKLLTTKGNRSHKLFQIAHIYPNRPTSEELDILHGVEQLGTNCEDSLNKIALCKDCHGYYDDHKTKEEYQWLVAKKKELVKKNLLKNAGYEFKLEEEIKLVIEKLSMLKLQEVRDLNYEGIEIKRKIKEDLLLEYKVNYYVKFYFFYIRETFTLLDKNDILKFNLIAAEISSYFRKCESMNEKQNEIFYAMVNWIKEKCKARSIEACEAVVSFFIQDCEVFDEIS